MSRAVQLSVVFILIFLIFISFSHAAKRTALVIGNASYSTGLLKNPTNDALDVARALEDAGFNVSLVINASSKDTKRAANSFKKYLQKHGGVGLFYFSGHGIQVNGRNYLIPVDLNKVSESALEFEALDVGQLLGNMKQAGTDVNILILDASRNNPFTRSIKSSSKGLAKMIVPDGSIIAFAASPGSVSANAEGRNELFTKHLLENIKKPGISVESVLKNVSVAVAKETSNQQIPWQSSSLKENIILSDASFETQTVKSSNSEPIVLDKQNIELELKKIELEYAKLELEKKRLEQVQEMIGIEKEKILESKPVNIASLEFDDNDPNILAVDGHYIRFKSGIVYDRKTNMEWFPGPDRGTDPKRAIFWVKNLKLDGGGWRMPTISELKTLYKKGVNSIHINPNLKTHGWYIYGKYCEDHKFSAFDYKAGRPICERFGSNNITPIYPAYSPFRAFAVRNKKNVAN